MSFREPHWKRPFDLLLAVIGLVVAGPVIAIAAWIARFDTGRSGIFRQERIGQDGIPFQILKIRTMRDVAGLDSSTTSRHDPRVTRFGDLLRKTKIDELPQIWNVLRGEMSVVGPRPTVQEDVDRMSEVERRRHLVRPGLTGLVQVRGGTSLSWPQRLKLDCAYVDQLSFGNDCRIVLRTVWLIISGSVETHPPGEDEWANEDQTVLPLGTGMLTVNENKMTVVDAASERDAPTNVSFAPWPVFDEEMVEATAAVVRSGKVNYWTGREGRAFEAEFAAFTGCKHAIALSNGTVALELALYALGIGPGDEVIVPSRTFIATASSVVARGAKPICADVDANSQTITAQTIRPVLTERTKAIIPVHLAGWPCEMDEILALAKERNLYVIEDCAQAHGAEYKGRPIGSLGDMGAFSFCQDKILTTGGEGGMLVTNDSGLWERAWQYKDHGKPPAVFYEKQPVGVRNRLVHGQFGTNFRMTEMQSAIGRLMLARLTGWVAIRQRHANRLAQACRAIPALRTPEPSHDITHAYYKFYTFVRPSMLAPGWTRDRIIEEIRDAGVPCFGGSCSEIYLEDAFPAEWKPDRPWPVAHELGETSLMFLVHPTLSDESIQATCDAIGRVMAAAMTGLDRSGNAARTA